MVEENTKEVGLVFPMKTEGIVEDVSKLRIAKKSDKELVNPIQTNCMEFP